jgi:hypothetical protein
MERLGAPYRQNLVTTGTPDRSKQLFVLEKQDLIGATGSVWAASGATNAERWRRDV